MQKVKEHSYPPWIISIVVVEFDLDEGQKVMLSVPHPLEPQRDKEISMLAFPDSNNCNQNQTLYKYIFKTSQEQFAFVCFKQKKDVTNKRGYAQKSFVVLTRLPFLIFFQKLSEFLVFKLYNLENEALQNQLEKIIKQSQEWAEPEPLSKFKLPVLDYEIDVHIPNYLFNSGTGFIKAQNFPSSNRKDKPSSIEEGVNQEILLQLGMFQQVKLTQVFRAKEEQLWTLWEHAILNRPVLIMAQTPHLASQSALAAASLTNPIQFSGQLHPYVTVYDSHLNQLQNAEQNVLLGATNPLFTKLFSKGKVQLLHLNNIKEKKYLRPVRQLFLASSHEHQRLVNESALRKYFFKANCGIIAILEEYLEKQTNDLKFFNAKEFMRFVKKREGEDPVSLMFDSKKSVLLFWQQLIRCRNFLNLLRVRNVVRNLT